MSIHGIGQQPLPIGPRDPGEHARDGHPVGERPARSPAAADVRSAPAPVPVPEPPPGLGVAALAPPGTDPALWSVLTSEERAWFERAQALGPVTYGPDATAPAAPLRRGARIDLRV